MPGEIHSWGGAPRVSCRGRHSSPEGPSPPTACELDVRTPEKLYYDPGWTVLEIEGC